MRSSEVGAKELLRCLTLGSLQSVLHGTTEDDDNTETNAFSLSSLPTTQQYF
jgi:hypothetical protein